MYNILIEYKYAQEAGYYFTHLISAVTFAEILDANSLAGIEPDEFDRYA